MRLWNRAYLPRVVLCLKSEKKVPRVRYLPRNKIWRKKIVVYCKTRLGSRGYWDILRFEEWNDFGRSSVNGVGSNFRQGFTGSRHRASRIVNDIVITDRCWNRLKFHLASVISDDYRRYACICQRASQFRRREETARKTNKASRPNDDLFCTSQWLSILSFPEANS